MKKLFFISAIILILGTDVKGQIMSAQLAYFNGLGTIFYPYGYYQGGVVMGVANGQGTFYYVNGTFFKGYFYQGLANGPGVIVIPYRGYLTGCWSNGQYVGNCQQTANPYDDSSKVDEAVDDVQSAKPVNSSKYLTVAKNNYRITQIDPDTQLGQSVLGNYNPPNH